MFGSFYENGRIFQQVVLDLLVLEYVPTLEFPALLPRLLQCQVLGTVPVHLGIVLCQTNLLDLPRTLLENTVFAWNIMEPL